MKKLTCLFIALLGATFASNAAPVSSTAAQKVATNFFSQVSAISITKVSLAYTETDPSNNPVYYVFNINDADGFVIVTADDALQPIIGYSTEKRPYTVPKSGTTVDYWMQKRKAEIIADVSQKIPATDAITATWTAYTNNTPHSSNNRVMSGVFPSSSIYLVQSTWDQPAPYNDDCPGVGSNQAVTGCVATAMCQIMRYWQYPTTGQGSSSYYCNYYSQVLAAKYDHGYPWAAMPLTAPPSSDTNIARAMSDAGISVEMDYSPTESGAYVITQENPYACAQISYVKYFKYAGYLIDGNYEFGNTTAWQDTLEHELNCSRPIQYAGYDPTEGGHTWVCDGYDINNNFHMNWGWSGLDDGWFALTSLTPAGQGNFSSYQEALIGIMPAPAAAATPVASFTSSGVKTCSGNAVQYVDTSTNKPTSWNWTFPGGTPSSSTLQDPVVFYQTTGVYNVKLYVSNNTGADSLTKTSMLTVNQTPAAPTLVQNGSTLNVTPSNYPHYEWVRNNETITGQTSDQLNLNQAGIYEVIVTDANGCTSEKSLLVLNPLGVNNISVDDNISIYPNPTNGNVKIDINIPQQGDYTLSVANILGQTLYTGHINLSGPYTTNLNMSNYGKGMYFLSIKGENSNLVKKVIVY